MRRRVPATMTMMLTTSRWAIVISLSAFAACAPSPSTTPLGLGPLALAEAAMGEAREEPSAEQAPSASTETETEAKTASAEPEDDEAPSDDDAEATELEVEATGSSSAVAGFEGLYAGDDVAVFRLPGFPDREQLDDKAKIRIEQDSETVLRVALINSENGSDLCELVAQVEGKSAELDAGQPCFSSEGEGAISAQMTSGTLVLDGDRLRMDARGTLSVTLADQEVEGELSYSFKGKRQ